MKLIFIIPFVLFFLNSNLKGQLTSQGEIYAFLSDWSTSNDFDKATYFMQKNKINDTLFVCRYYRKAGPMIRWESFYDSILEIPNGTFGWYNKSGFLDSTGTVTRGIKDKIWQYALDDKNHPTLFEEYLLGDLIKKNDVLAGSVTDNNGTIQKITGIEFLKIMPWNNKSSIEKHAEFKQGGISGWIDYLSIHTITPERLIKIVGPGKTVSVTTQFVIDLAGHVSNIFIIHSLEWSADNEAIRVLSESPPWIAASENGKKVSYSQIQKITFKVDN
jgi:hypothetical protein